MNRTPDEKKNLKTNDLAVLIFSEEFQLFDMRQAFCKTGNP